MSKKKDYLKESATARSERLALSCVMTTKVIKDKSKYSRKEKHKSKSGLCFSFFLISFFLCPLL